MNDIRLKEIGKIVKISPPIVKIKGLLSVKEQEVLLDGSKKFVVFKFDEDFIYGLALGSFGDIRVGDEIERTGRLLTIPVGEELLGRLINPLGRDIITGKNLDLREKREVEVSPPRFTERGLVREPLETGIKLVDALFPIGRGQRELILGDRRTGKTSLALDIILNQKDVICIYCSIGQRRSEILEIENTLLEFGAKDYTILIGVSASDPPALQYLAPFSAMTLAEYFRDEGKDVLVVFDDLTKHAWIWRQISLLLEMPPGREAYPGDIFYLHARLLERAGKLIKGGSITALPICQTKEGDITEYVPTNLISITDGQLYLETSLFQRGIRPAINIGLSVSRIGGLVQRKYLKEVTKGMRLLLSQHQELKKLVQLETKISKESKKKFERGEILLEVFKQQKHNPVDTISQSIIYFAILNGFLDGSDIERIPDIEKRFYQFFNDIHPEIKEKLFKNHWIDSIKEEVKALIQEFKSRI